MEKPATMKNHRKAGYSLVEMVFVSLLGSLALGQVLVALLWGQGIYRDVIAISELTTASRMIRERTLYHLVEGDGGLASLDIKTCSIGPDRHGIAFSIGREMPRYRLSFDPYSAESGFDLQKIQGTGEDKDKSIFNWFPLHSTMIDVGSQFGLYRLDDNRLLSTRTDSNLARRYYLANDFELTMQNGGRTYARKCRVRSPIVNDTTK